jgi:hypothetical protein
MTRWHVEINRQGNDQRLLEDVLAGFDVEIEQTERGWFLVSDRFEVLSGSGEVRALAVKIAAALELAGRDNSAIKFDVGSLILEHREDGSIGQHRSIIADGVASLSMTALGIAVTIRPSASLSAAEQQQAHQRQLEQEHRQRAERLSHRALAAFKNEAATRIQRWLAATELDTTTMNAIAELIEENMGSARKDLDREREFGRFFGSINHQEIFGDQARHATSAMEPHPKPMSPAEAQVFIRDVAERWFKHVAEGT